MPICLGVCTPDSLILKNVDRNKDIFCYVEEAKTAERKFFWTKVTCFFRKADVLDCFVADNIYIPWYSYLQWLFLSITTILVWIIRSICSQTLNRLFAKRSSNGKQIDQTDTNSETERRRRHLIISWHPYVLNLVTIAADTFLSLSFFQLQQPGSHESRSTQKYPPNISENGNTTNVFGTQQILIPLNNEPQIIGKPNDCSLKQTPQFSPNILCIAFRPRRVKQVSVALGTTSGPEIWTVSNTSNTDCHKSQRFCGETKEDQILNESDDATRQTMSHHPLWHKEPVDMKKLSRFLKKSHTSSYVIPSSDSSNSCPITAIAWSTGGRDLLMSHYNGYFILLTERFDTYHESTAVWSPTRIIDLSFFLTPRLPPRRNPSLQFKIGDPVKHIVAADYCPVRPLVAALSRGGDVILIETITWKFQVYSIYLERGADTIDKLQWFPPATGTAAFLVASSRQLIEFQFCKQPLQQEKATSSVGAVSNVTTTIIGLSLPEHQFESIPSRFYNDTYETATALLTADLRDFAIEQTKGTRIAVIFEQSRSVFIYRYQLKSHGTSTTVLESVIAPSDHPQVNIPVSFFPMSLSFSTHCATANNNSDERPISFAAINGWNKDIDNTLNCMHQSYKEGQSSLQEINQTVWLATKFVNTIQQLSETAEESRLAFFEINISSTRQSFNIDSTYHYISTMP